MFLLKTGVLFLTFLWKSICSFIYFIWRLIFTGSHHSCPSSCSVKPLPTNSFLFSFYSIVGLLNIKGKATMHYLHCGLSDCVMTQSFYPSNSVTGTMLWNDMQITVCFVMLKYTSLLFTIFNRNGCMTRVLWWNRGDNKASIAAFV